MTGRHTRRWFAAIPITGRFYIMLAILVLAEAGLVAGCLHAMQLQTEASGDLARVAAVQRSLDRALTLHAKHRRRAAVARRDAGTRLTIWSARCARSSISPGRCRRRRKSPRSPKRCGRRPRSISKAPKNTCARVAARAAPRRGHSPISNRGASALETALREAMMRMRGVLLRVETRVLAEADRVRRGDGG